MDAEIPMITTTIRSSIRVKPLCFLILRMIEVAPTTCDVLTNAIVDPLLSNLLTGACPIAWRCPC